MRAGVAWHSPWANMILLHKGGGLVSSSVAPGARQPSFELLIPCVSTVPPAGHRVTLPSFPFRDSRHSGPTGLRES